MRAAILAIGDELTLGESLDTNSAWLAAKLRERAIDIVEHRTLGDDERAIGAAISELTGQCELLITTGGLGPTADDLTRHGLGLAVSPKDDLVQDERALRHLQALYRSRGRTMPETNLVQTLRPATASMIPNPNGSAMGLADVLGECRIFCLPGPRREMMPMFEHHVAPLLPEINSVNMAGTRFVHACGISESEAAQRLGDLLARTRTPQIGITVSNGLLTVRIRARGARPVVERLLDADARAVENALSPYVFGSDDQTLPKVVGELLARRGERVATAESCTGGMLGSMIVDVPGSSAYYVGGWVTYSDAMKQRELAVPAQILEQHGAVSAEVARAMAHGALHHSDADWAVSITGVAGPDGGTAQKPVGLVYIALAARGHGRDGATAVRGFNFIGEREIIRMRSALIALQMLRLAMLELDGSTRLLWETTDDTGAPDAPFESTVNTSKRR